MRRDYIERGTPAIIEGVPLPNPKIRDPAYLRKHFMASGRKGLAWYNTILGPPDNDLFNTPTFVREILTSPDAFVRADPIRVWLQPSGHKTLLHYDGNSLCGFNLLVTGRKHWKIVSPHTPPPCLPFNAAALTSGDDLDESGKLVFEFETEPGDLLFLPRYWLHSVSTLAPTNINVNWVWTPSKPDLSSPIGQREAEILKLTHYLPALSRLTFDGRMSYGGGGDMLVKTYIENVPAFRAALRLLRELLLVPRAFLYRNTLSREVQRFRASNFNVENS